jgi:choline-glycine betaine transporter
LLFWSISEPVYHFLNQWQKEELLKLRKLWNLPFTLGFHAWAFMHW